MDENDLILILEDSSSYISGEKISEIAGVSRTYVWKLIQKLRKLGFVIDSSTNKGYKLVFSDNISKMQDLNNAFNEKIKYIENCESTNNLARKGWYLKHPEGTLYITDNQTSGKGRLGRSWHNEPGKAISMSVLLTPNVQPNAIMPISLFAGLAVCKAINNICNIDCKLKWPNDILFKGSKIGGILIESATSGEKVQYISLGIGINVNNENFPPELKDKASSLFLATGIRSSRKDLILQIMKNLHYYYFEWLAEYNKTDMANLSTTPFSFMKEYKSLCVTLGSDIKIINEKETIKAKAIDILPDGALQIKLSDGTCRAVLSGEVSVRGTLGYTD